VISLIVHAQVALVVLAPIGDPVFDTHGYNIRAIQDSYTSSHTKKKQKPEDAEDASAVDTAGVIAAKVAATAAAGSANRSLAEA